MGDLCEVGWIRNVGGGGKCIRCEVRRLGEVG